ncbi:hypothetical protein AB3R30_25200 [Leptolyngbyaceae cyanobacterium UHCC 1019]
MAWFALGIIGLSPSPHLMPKIEPTTKPLAIPPTPPKPATTLPAKPKPPETTKPPIPAPGRGTSPIARQHRDIRSQPDYNPCKLIILNGTFANKAIDLGIDIPEISHSEAPSWESQESDKVRPVLNFKNLGNRSISFDCTFFDLNNDVAHLAENLKHIAQITGNEAAPPRLLFVQGALRAVECVCTSFNDKYSDPLPGNKGYRKAVCSIELKLNGGRDNANALGAPLAATPLQDQIDRESVQDRQKRARVGILDTLMAPCLKEKSAELRQLVDANKQGDIDAIARLSPETFVQSAIAGVFSPELLKSERLQSKLKQDLALAIAQSEPSVMNNPVARNFAVGLASNDVGFVPKNLQPQFPKTYSDYQKILTAISDQTLDEASSVFGNDSRSAAEKLYRVGNCGLDLRRNGGKQLAATSGNDAQNLKSINQFFGSKPSSEQIMQRFGVDAKAAESLKNGQPYQTKNDFIKHNSQGKPESVGYGLWVTFEKNSTSA